MGEYFKHVNKEYVNIPGVGRIVGKTEYGKKIIEKYNRDEETMNIAEMRADKNNFEFFSKDDIF